MRLTTIAVVLYLILAASPAMAQDWASDPQTPPDVAVVDAEPASDSLRAAAADVMKRRPFFDRIRNRKLGLTAWSIGREVVAIHKAGKLDGLSQDELAIEVATRLAEKHPEAYAAEKAQWDTENPVGDEGDSFLDRVIALILRWLPLILLFL